MRPVSPKRPSVTPTPDRPPAAPVSPFDPALAQAGRVPTLVVLMGLLMTSSLPFVASLVQGRAQNVAQGVLSMCLTVFLLGMVWRGSVLAWRLTIGLAMLAGLLVFVVGMLTGTTAWQGWVVSGAGLVYLGLGTALVGTPSIRAFLDSRWAARSAARRSGGRA
ncbi:hypothetical protein CBQ26_05620 [Deinococcus indicus]|uniref:Uncharacterized protein n=1 Tax=Deinococcus indicus TaxID=223556 RepID=A0A246BPY1_9DEIO|nr:hypothetical protein CBQ26_05620 [Deinococcus indicus]GHG17598.1 hypothetical protein GCM10017784_05660 [Deinococcus indicus]